MNNDKLNSIISAIQSKAKGAERTLEQARPAKTKKAFTSFRIIKKSTIPCRFVNYARQATVKKAREEGRQEMPNNWQSFGADCDGLFRDSKGNFKICVGHSALGRKGSKEWTLDGKPVELEEIKHMLLSSEYKASSMQTDWFTLNADNITKIDEIEIK